MEGFDAPYIPGWDCHGLPIEHQVEKIIDCYSKNFNNFKNSNKNEWYRISASRKN